jgi:predicted Zn finger-like uncharacterized protein
MPLVITCPKCSKRYQVPDAAAGKQVRCQQCQTAFVAAAHAPAPALLAPLGVSDPLAGADLSRLPSANLPTANLPAATPLGNANPLGAPVRSAAGGFYPAAPAAAATGISNPSGGPTDAVMRMVSGGMLAAGLIMVVGSIAMTAANQGVYLAVIGLAPLALILGTAGLISPNVVRACGKYGGHLPWQYKAIGYGLFGLYFVILILLMVGLFMAGFRPDRPGA